MWKVVSLWVEKRKKDASYTLGTYLAASLAPLAVDEKCVVRVHLGGHPEKYGAHSEHYGCQETGLRRDKPQKVLVRFWVECIIRMPG